jgi:hypothetical protein
MKPRKIRLLWALFLLLSAGSLAACEIISSTDEGKLIDTTTETTDGGAPDAAPDGGDSGADGG